MLDARRISVLLLAASPLLAQGDAQPFAGTPIHIPGVRKLTVGAQYRLRYEAQIDLDLDDDTRPGVNDFFTQRARFALGFDLSERLSMFLQLQDVREWGEETNTLLDYRADGLDMHQAWAEVRQTPGLGGTTRLGRTEFSLGDQRLVGAVDWKSQARSFDGIVQTWTASGGDTLQAWAFQIRETASPATVNDDMWFFGAQASGRCCAHTQGDVYLMLLHDDGIAPGATQNRVTLGTRWVHGAGEPWEIGCEAATQAGEQAGADIPIGKTWAAHAHVTRRFAGDSRPWLRLEANAASGDDPATADRERFHNLFPTAHAHWGMLDLALWENMFQPLLQGGIKPCAASELTLAWSWFRAMEGRDSFGGPNGTLIAANQTDSRTIGHEIDLVYTRQLDLGTTARTAVQLGYGVFLPGAAPESVGRDTTGHFAYAQFDLRF